MAKINEMNDFIKLTSNITSFSHAYLFDVNSLEIAFSYVKEFAKMIICGHEYFDEKYKDICYQIDNSEYDDLYIVKPDTIGINTEEINKLLNYMETKSLRDNGRRVYIIYGFERLSRDVSNKILKFLEEPNDNIYAILMTENVDRILSTIISRCQIIRLTFDIEKNDINNILRMKDFLENIFIKKNNMIAYYNDYFYDIMSNRIEIFEYFDILEEIICKIIRKKCGEEIKNEFSSNILEKQSLAILVNILNITSNLKTLIKNNININLLLDRYIIEITKELILC